MGHVASRKAVTIVPNYPCFADKDFRNVPQQPYDSTMLPDEPAYGVSPVGGSSQRAASCRRPFAHEDTPCRERLPQPGMRTCNPQFKYAGPYVRSTRVLAVEPRAGILARTMQICPMTPNPTQGVTAAWAIRLGAQPDRAVFPFLGIPSRPLVAEVQCVARSSSRVRRIRIQPTSTIIMSLEPCRTALVQV